MNRILRPIRPDGQGVSAFYGAFCVLAVATVVVGLILGSPLPRAAPAAAEDGKLADLFLATLLASSIDDATSYKGAIERLCWAPPCPHRSYSAENVSAAIAHIGAPLAKSLERAWSFCVTDGNSTLVLAGNLGASMPGTASRVDVGHDASQSFLQATVRLGRL